MHIGIDKATFRLSITRCYKDQKKMITELFYQIDLNNPLIDMNRQEHNIKRCIDFKVNEDMNVMWSALYRCVEYCVIYFVRRITIMLYSMCIEYQVCWISSLLKLF